MYNVSKTSGSTFLDRKDNDVGYIFDNVVSCCWRCNDAKSNAYTYLEWFNMTKYFRDLKDDKDLTKF